MIRDLPKYKNGSIVLIQGRDKIKAKVISSQLRYLSSPRHSTKRFFMYTVAEEKGRVHNIPEGHLLEG